MTIYLDTCALNRPTDDLSQLRIRRAAEAVGRILDLVFERKVIWFAGTILLYELSQNPDPLRRVRALGPLAAASQILVPDATVLLEAKRLAEYTLSSMDALHLGLAHTASVEWFITTDDRLIRSASRAYSGTAPVAVNPVDSMQRRHPWLLQHPSP